MSRQELEIYSTPAFSCSYLDGKMAVNAVLNPATKPDIGIYSRLVEMGFRRSGSHVYRPQCPNCEACRPSRVIVAKFQPSRSQKRCWKSNQDLSAKIYSAQHQDEYFELYSRYLHARHPDGGMENATADNYLDFLTSPWSDTHFVEFRLEKRLLCVAVVDKLQHGYSSIYTFFDPDEKKRSLGVYAILWQIASAHSAGIPWIYLGYWIKDCDKMRYKMDYKPLEVQTSEGWIRLDESDFASSKS
jgi:arginine-tRNA-protein transferase